MRDILVAFWFFIPAGLANGAPVVAAALPKLRDLNSPLDAGKTWRGKRIFGEHKTWRGLAVGTLAATVATTLQWLIAQIPSVNNYFAPLDYAHSPFILLGILFGAGVIAGDAIESFFKRQIGIKPGHSWFPFDQIDYIIGGALAAAPIMRLTLAQYAWMLGLWLIIHMLGAYLGYLGHIKDKPI